MSARTGLHPLTGASIQAQGVCSAANEYSEWPCGCEHRSIRLPGWWLCGYHEGFEDAIEALAEHGPKWTATVTLGEELTTRLECPRCQEPWPCPAITPEPRPMPDLHPTTPFPAVETVAGQPCCGDDR